LISREASLRCATVYDSLYRRPQTFPGACDARKLLHLYFMGAGTNRSAAGVRCSVPVKMRMNLDGEYNRYDCWTESNQVFR